ncbi:MULTISPECIES: DUF7694 domain-containing protein [Caproicibacterium]|uniref:DUF7694 domain-containing protein n=1 Tax=Caproicibacterium argilliputei TaxID=3030016 RepID=A0AA97DBK8_9FIRM|nr:hypothetical protein [Caproicibacterium argilliputei]WOC33444.1 hypothetical protein PXC00_06150 [Caproicibacterium argilliputei]
MKNLTSLNRYREPINGDWGNNYEGCFKIFLNGKAFFAVASVGGGWDHVSVSTKNNKRCPTWDEMRMVKEMFFEPDEWAVQYNPPANDNISICDNCLHLWRPQNVDLPKPPKEFV